jgi:thiamine-monophosphate kinase
VKSLAAVGEFPFIEAIRRLAVPSSSRTARGGNQAPGRRGIVLGIGDDAACVRLRGDAVVTVDCVVEGVHFRRGWMRPVETGRRAFRAAVSDLSACGAKPRFALLALTMPPVFPVADALGFVRGLVRDAAGVGVALIGGNVSAAPVFSATLTLIGDAGPRLLRRDGARAGDAIYVSGPLGGSAAGVLLLERGVKQGPLQTRYRRPPLRIEAGRALARLRGIGAVIDVSDGLVQDLAHLCEASGVSAMVEVAAVPMPAALARLGRMRGAGRIADPERLALAGGEDYELLFTVRAKTAASGRVEELLAANDCTAHRIGRVVRRRRVAVIDAASGRGLAGGFTHFGGRK